MADLEKLLSLWRDATITYKKEGGVNELYL